MTAITTGTNIDVNTLVTQLMQVESQPLTAMQAKQQSYQTKITAYGKLQSAVSGLAGAASALKNSDTFTKSSASVSDAGVLSATTGSNAVAGTHSVEVQQLAQPQQLASNRFAGNDSVVGTGTLSFQFGSSNGASFAANAAKNSFNVVIDSSNNTLAGVRDAINQANGGVLATIVNDGSGYRLALQPTDAGLANSLKITAADTDGNATDMAGLSQLAFDPFATAGAGRNLAQNTAPRDALAVIDGISVTSPTNKVAAIPGLTLNLAKTNIGAPVSVTVTPDTSAVKTAINSFVSAYNSFNSQVHSLTYYDASTKTAGALQGDATANSIVRQVRNLLTTPMSGLAGGLSGLSQVGVSLQSDGTISFDSSKLEKALADPTMNVASLFTTTATPSDSRVSFQSSLSSTPAGSYALTVTQPATRGTLAGSDPAALTITAGVNDTFNLTVNGQAASVTLGAATYASADALAAEIQNKLNNAPAFVQNGVTVAVTQSGGVLSLAAANYGSNSSVSGLSGNAAALFGGSPVATNGVNIAGTVNGAAATGNGQTLVGADGLRVIIPATAAGSFGTVTLSNGYGTQLDNLIGSLTDTATGPIASRTTGLNSSISRLTAEQASFNERLSTIEANYRRQFSSLDAALTQMKSTQSFLTQQLAGLANNSNN